VSYLYSKSMLFTLLFICICIGSTALAYYSLNSLGNKASNQADTPDSFMQEVNFTRYDAQGIWESRFYTPHTVHYPKQNTAIIDRPRLTSRGGAAQADAANTPHPKEEDNLIWVITAQHGNSQDDGKIIYLTGQVQIQRIDQTTKKTATMSTSALTAYPKQKYLETDQPVRIVQPGSTIDSVGFTANLNSGDIHLLSKTDSTYVASPPK
jgi:lipopolysaccharide export system protein LptC